MRGKDGAAIQRLLGDFVAQHGRSARIVGAIEQHGGDARDAARLRILSDGRGYPLFQDLGPGATGCSLDPRGVVLAGEAVRRDIALGCDLVVLSKFGKLEAESGSGLVAAFAAAIEADVPILTSVSPRYDHAWEQFAAPFCAALKADSAHIDDWWQAASTHRDSRYGV